MEITSDNFFQSLPLIQESISQADFIAIDTEFSGHSAMHDDKGHEYDTVEERYQKLKFVCQKFIAFQMGICTFKWDDHSKKYKCRPFCFYVYPKSKINDATMMFQASAINFLVKNNFDFNKLFSSAINFAQLKKEQQLEQECLYKVTKTFPSMRSFTSLSTTHQKLLEDMISKIHEWVYDPCSEDKIIFQIQSYSLKKALSKEVTKVYMNTGIFTDYIREKPDTVVKKSKQFNQSNFIKGYHPVDEFSQSTLGFQEVDEDMKDQAQGMQQPEEEKSNTIKPTNTPSINTTIKSQLNSNSTDQEIKELFKQELGFTQVIKFLIEAKKPLIGHNMIFDLGFIFHQFIDNLPQTFELFRQQWIECFPSLYDTKVLSASTNAFGKTDLSHLHWKCVNDKKYNNNLVIEFDKEREQLFGLYEQNGGQGHDAGFDAYMTGHDFAQISKYIEIGKIIQPPKDKVEIPQQANGDSKPKRNNRNTNINYSQVSQNSQETLSQPNTETKKKPRHYSAVQNQSVSFEDICSFQNKVMLAMDVPRYFPFDNKLTAIEQEYEEKMKDTVIWIKYKQDLTIQVIADLFNLYGDINIVKNTDKSAYIEFSYMDRDIVKSGQLKELLKILKSDKSILQFISEISTYESAERFNSKDYDPLLINQ